MKKIENIKSIIDQYLIRYNDETDRQSQFKEFLLNSSDNDLYNRKNYKGHITASAIIIDIEDSKILVIKHNILNRWLQPGGHVEKVDKSILDAALREVREEVNIRETDLRLVSPTFSDRVPFDIDSHLIPENKTKGEPKHYHHDFKYLFIYKGRKNITINMLDALDYKWKEFESLEDETSFKGVVKKIRQILSTNFRTKIFFENVLGNMTLPNSNIISVVVSHILPGCEYYHRALNKMMPIVTIIPKPNSIDKTVFENIKNEFDFTQITRDQISKTDSELVEKLKATSEDIVLLDIGGYFANISGSWPEEILDRVILIVEDTENGHQKHKLNSQKIKVVSVARSPLKDNEDFLVGQSVLFSADSILRTQEVLIQYQQCAVFGYGKIGKSISSHLIQRGINPYVYDINPIKRIEAFNRLSSIPTRDSIIKESDVIFSATGNRNLNIEDFRKLKNGCYIFSVTSSDDEMNLNFLETEYSKTIVTEHITKYYNDYNFFFLVNNGNAVNFIHKAIMANFVHLVRSEMLMSINEITKYKLEGINRTSTSLKKEIAEIWLKTYHPSSDKLDYII